MTSVLGVASVIARRDLLRQVRRPGTLAGNLVQLAFFVVVYAVGFDRTVGSVGGVPFSAYVLPGLVAVQVASMGLMSGLSYAWDREFGVLREMLVAPVPQISLPLGKVLATVLLAVVQTAVLLACAPLLHVHLPPGRFAAACAVAAAGAALFGTAGLLLATVLRRLQTLQVVAQSAMFPMLFLSGSVFSPEGLPAWLAGVVAANPLSYLVDLLRHVTLGPSPALLHTSPLPDLAVLGAALAVVALALRGVTGR